MAEHIQVGDTAPRIQYTGDGAQTAFTYPFPIFDDGDLEVYVDSTPSVLTTDYTVSGAGVSAGGDVTFLIAPADGTLITLRRNIAIQRISDFQQSGVLRAQVPRWLNEPENRARVLAFDYAQRHHGGMGALYVLLRKARA